MINHAEQVALPHALDIFFHGDLFGCVVFKVVLEMAVWVLYADALELHGLQDLVDHVEFDSFIWDHVLEWVVEKGAIMKRIRKVLTPKDVKART